MRFGDKACSKGPQCKNRDLEHIFIFHFKGYNPQPRFFDLEQTTPGKNLYIGFHQTDPKSAMLIAQSREGTERKVNRHGAFICAEIKSRRKTFISWQK
ncbi:unnamed protein product [Adineta steineri]|uniref:Uncharacterized protein n=1 Tax=Adineta steineri TaxID=433720 RepID=A0A813U8Q3_9BILA|nr:unnamed protein product [Adineta steineri]CAF1296697.1 unnamed protein product [Adineta steineri]